MNSPGGALFALKVPTPDDAIRMELSAFRARIVKILRSIQVPDSDAEDVAQQVLAELSRRPDADVSSCRRLGSAIWVAIRRSRTLRRQAETRRHEEHASAMHGGPRNLDQERLIIARDFASFLKSEVERMPDRQRAVVGACLIEGMSHAEAADAIGMPLGTVKSSLRRAIERLKKLIRDEIPEGGERW